MKNRKQQIGEAIVNRQLHSESRDTSFVMFPLRIETRFKRQMPLKTKEQHRVASVFAQLNQLFNDAILFSLLRPHEAEFTVKTKILRVVFQKYRNIFDRKYIAKHFCRLATLLGHLDGIYYEDKVQIVSLIRHIKMVAAVFPVEWQPSLTSICDDIYRYANSIPTAKSQKANRATVLLNRFEKMVRRMEVIAHYSTTPYRGKRVCVPEKGNLHLMRHLNKHIAESQSFVDSFLDELEKVPSMTANQRVRYKKCIRRIVDSKGSLSKDFRNNIENLNFRFSLTKWKEVGTRMKNSYCSDVNHVVNSLSAISGQLYTKIRKKPLTRIRYTHILYLMLQMKLGHLKALKTGEQYIYRPKTLRRMKDKVFFDYQKGKNLTVLMLQQFNVLYSYMNVEFDAQQWISFAEKFLLKTAEGRRFPIDTTSLERYEVKHSTDVVRSKESLCVRIYPDEVSINKFVPELTKQEADDGKRFWIRYTLALGNSVREREAWDALCDMYPPYRAGWIVRRMRPLKNLSEQEPFCTLNRLYRGLKLLQQEPGENAMQKLLTDLKKLTFLVDYHCDQLIKTLNTVDIPHGVVFKGKFKDGLNSIRCSVTEMVNRLLYGNDQQLKKRLTAWTSANLKQQSKVENSGKLEAICADILNAESSMSGMHGELISLLRKTHLVLPCINNAIVYLNGRGKDPVFPFINNYRTPNDFGKPVSPTLPERFLFEGTVRYSKNKKKTIVFYGRRTFPDLQVGLDLNENPDIDPFLVNLETGRLTVNSGIRWMTHYHEAEKMGMAITIPLDNVRRNWECFESIYVLGVKDCNVSESGKIINDLFHSHFYSEEGLNLLKIGTPTNILTGAEAEAAAYDTSKAVLADTHYRQDVKQEYRFKTDKTSDAFKFAAALNMDVSSENNPLLRVTGKDNHEIHRALMVNQRLLSHYFSQKQLSHHDKKVKGFIERVCHFIQNDVTARGLYPPIRIGAQPYGIIPVTDFEHYQVQGDSLNKISRLLVWLTARWNDICDRSVIHEGNLSIGGDPVKRYLEMIGCTPTSSTFYSRKEVAERDLLNPVYFRGKIYLNSAMADAERFIFALLSLSDKSAKRPGEGLLNLLSSFNKLPISDSQYTSEIKSFHWNELKNLLGDLRMDEKEKELLITEFYDLFTYRFDAWMIGLLNYAIRLRIKKQKHKVRIGAFGWVFNLKPDKQEACSYEYILAPSINHAVTGAILRSSYNRAREGKADNYRLSVNLSSVRVREALRLIRGLQNGLSVGAVLGVDLERYLHDCYRIENIEMDALIYPLRQKYPLVADVYSDSQKSPNHSVVINGEALIYDLRHVRLASIYEKDTKQLYDLFIDNRSLFINWANEVFGSDYVQKNNQKIDLLIKQLQRVEDTFDALSDVILTESVYKLSEGNRVAVDALMSCVQQGKNIPMPDVVDIPMHSAHVEQRVMVALNTGAVADPNTDSIMQLADPAVDEWLDRMLGGLRRIGVGFRCGRTTDVASLAIQLGLTASEVVYLSDNGESFFRFLEWMYLTSISALPEEAPQIDLYPTYAIESEEDVWLGKAQLVVDSLRESLVDSRALKIDDLIKENLSADSSEYDLNDLKTRFEAVLRKLKQWDELMTRWEANASTADLLSDEVLLRGIRLLLGCYRFGLAQAVDGLDFNLLTRGRKRSEHPEGILQAEELRQTFIPHFYTIHRLLQARLKVASESTLQKVNDYTKAMQELLCKSFRMVPRMAVNTELIDADGYRKQLADDFHFSNLSPEGLEEWMIEAAKVRKSVLCVQHARMFQQWHDFDEVSLTVLQTPSPDDAEWIGTTLSSEARIVDKRSYVLLNKEQMLVSDTNGYRPMTGLVLDYWVERIPYKTQTAGLAFSYDQPDAEAPNAILLALSPNISSSASRKLSKNWSRADFERSIKSAMHLVKSRAVEPDHIYNDYFASAFFPLLPYPTDQYKTNNS